MNERIRELTRQADPEYTGEYNDDMGHALVGNEAIQKFAELIVRECVQVCADRGTHHDRLYSAWAEDCSKRIAKHFGVEE